jgi:predicted nuclease of predicted toxin-antitoxin system
VKLLIDMNLSPLWVDFLTSAGIDTAHWASVGERDALDTEIMAYAAAEDYVVLTHDLDFGAILAATNGARGT